MSDAATNDAETAVSITVNGQQIDARQGELLIDAAEDALGTGDGASAETEATETASADAENGAETATAEPLSPSQYVEAARQQLEIAEALGYGDKADFKELRDNLDDLDEKIDASEDAGNIFDKIGDSFIRLKQRIFD